MGGFLFQNDKEPKMAQKQVSINNEQRRYVIPCGDGYTCFGFDNCYSDALAMSQMMGVEPPDALSIGTLDCYNAFLELSAAFAKHPASKDIWFTPGTPDKVRKILKQAIRSRKDLGNDGMLLRFFTGDTTTGLDWCNEWDMVGYVGQSTGSKKIPLLIEPLVRKDGSIRSACGGGALLTDCILRIINVKTRKELYRAPNYKVPVFVIGTNDQVPKLSYFASRDGQVAARFSSHGEACEYVAFMMGDLPSKGFTTVEEYENSFVD